MARAERVAPTAELRTADAVRWFEPWEEPIEHATDLGSVQVLKHEDLSLLTDPFGDIQPDSRGLGLYHGDTRVVSSSILRIGGQRPVLLQGSAGGNYRGTIHLTNPTFERNVETKIRPDLLPTQALGMTRHRVIGSRGLEERVRVVNHSEHEEVFDVELGVASDAADIFEVRGYVRRERGSVLPIAVRGRRVTFRYDGLDGIRRSTFLAFSEAPVEVAQVPEGDHGFRGSWVRLRWRWRLPPLGRGELTWTTWTDERPVRAAAVRDGAPDRDGARDDDFEGLFPDPPRVTGDEGAAAYRAWRSGTSGTSTSHDLFNLTCERSLADLRLLINPGPDPGERYVSAGVPWFATLFGRDSIITALQVLAFRPQLAVETLGVLASHQATEIDDAHDAEPGKILHELRTGEMARTGELPFSPYYGSVDATPLWLVLFSRTWAWTGDRRLIDRLWPNALAALRWIDEWGDRDGDGFVEYARRAPNGLINQGWKDSHDSVRYRHGGIASGPIALAEVQGYVYDAKRGMAGLARVRGEDALAERLEAEARVLRDRFEEAFWVRDRGFYAMALDGEKRQVDAFTSNPGHCLWSRIVAPERARDVADHLVSPQLFSGWGIRTYGAGEPGYNPIGYHVGSVWPHDTAIVAAGLKAYGFHDEANRVVSAMFEAAQSFGDFRLPELFCGFDREASAVPVPYPVACSPQAWAAGATFFVLETMLGLRPHAERNELELDRPMLPDWLEKVTLSNVRVGEAAVDLLFHRWRGTTSAEVLRKVGDVSVTIRI